MFKGLEKDLLLPFKQQTRKVKTGEQVLAALYIDKSGRLCATMNVYEHLRTDSPYKKDDKVTGRIYEISKNFGAFVAVDNCFSGYQLHVLFLSDALARGDHPLRLRDGRIHGDAHGEVVTVLLQRRHKVGHLLGSIPLPEDGLFANAGDGRGFLGRRTALAAGALAGTLRPSATAAVR